MREFSTVVLAAVWLLAACAAPKSEVTHEEWETTSRLDTGETVVVTGEYDLAECVSDALAETSPATQLISNEEFRSQLYPWFEPETAPQNEEAFQSLLERPLVSQKLGELGLHYVVIVRGNTREQSFSSDLVSFLPVAGVGRATSLHVSVWDPKSAELVGNLDASASGTFMMLPIIVPAATESMACSDIASELAEFLGDEPSQGE